MRAADGHGRGRRDELHVLLVLELAALIAERADAERKLATAGGRAWVVDELVEPHLAVGPDHQMRVVKEFQFRRPANAGLHQLLRVDLVLEIDLAGCFLIVRGDCAAIGALNHRADFGGLGRRQLRRLKGSDDGHRHPERPAYPSSRHCTPALSLRAIRPKSSSKIYT